MWIEAADDASAVRPDPSTSKQPLALIAGSSVNTNGRASSLTAPHGPSQQELIAVALAAGGLAAQDVTGIVLHANGTSLGECCGRPALIATAAEARRVYDHCIYTYRAQLLHLLDMRNLCFVC